MLNDASILITGGTGSFGRKFADVVLKRYNMRRLIIFSRDEYKQYEMAQQVNGPEVRYFIGDVRDQGRLEMALKGVDYVIHAAALKHVPIAEYNPFECIRTNVEGAENVVRASIRAGVKRVVALSTDKAANPSNLYGASKLCSDKIFLAAMNVAGADGPIFSVVRYGNVVGSRGSVVPLFRNFVRQGADHLPITDPRMTRFWITLQHGVDFVMSSLETMQGGELFVPKIPSVKVVDLASVIAPGLPHKTVGIRPGEKLHEVMITDDDARATVDLGDRYVILPEGSDLHRSYLNNASPVSEGFRYASDSNPDFLDEGRIKQMLDTAEV